MGSAWVKVDADGDLNWRPHVALCSHRVLGEVIDDFPILVWMPEGIYGSHIRQVY